MEETMQMAARLAELEQEIESDRITFQVIQERIQKNTAEATRLRRSLEHRNAPSEAVTKLKDKLGEYLRKYPNTRISFYTLRRHLRANFPDIRAALKLLEKDGHCLTYGFSVVTYIPNMKGGD